MDDKSSPFNPKQTKASKQEMVQSHLSRFVFLNGLARTENISSRASSPFWRAGASQGHSNSSRARERIKDAPIGASYSHADILKFDELSLSTSARPFIPPSLSTKASSANPPQASISVGTKKPGRFELSSSYRPHRKDWSMDEEDVFGGEQFGYDVNDEEDEFGLPSISSVRKPGKREGVTKMRSPHDTIIDDQASLGGRLPSGDRTSNRNNSSEKNHEEAHPTSKTPEKTLRPQHREILRDPVHALNSINHPKLPLNAGPKEVEASLTRLSRINKFKRILQASTISLPDLRASSWSGIPSEVRAMAWQVLLGYLPTASERRANVLERKRKEYLEGVTQVFEGCEKSATSSLGAKPRNLQSDGRGRGLDESVWHQISIDVPRTSPHIELYGFEQTQRSLERILYLWAIRHPASGYVQGINDLVTPFWQVFLGTYVTDSDVESGLNPGSLPRSIVDAVEADSYWCLTKLLDGIQDNYIYAQPGIVRQVNALGDLTHRIDKSLASHLKEEGVEFMQFSFRWMNCLLMREVNIKCTIRMWDTYMAEDQGFSEFHLYVCAAFLVKWTDQLAKKDFQEIMMFLQALPTKDWNEKDVELLLSEAYIWQSLFRGSSAHLKNSGSAKIIT